MTSYHFVVRRLFHWNGKTSCLKWKSPCRKKVQKYANEWIWYMIFYQNTKHNQRNYIIVGIQSSFVIINTIIFGQFRTNYPLHGKKERMNHWLRIFFFSWWRLYLLWIMSSSLHASKLLALKKPSLIMLFSFAHPCHGGVATSSLQGPPHRLEGK